MQNDKFERQAVGALSGVSVVNQRGTSLGDVTAGRGSFLLLPALIYLPTNSMNLSTIVDYLSDTKRDSRIDPHDEHCQKRCQRTAR